MQCNRRISRICRVELTIPLLLDIYTAFRFFQDYEHSLISFSFSRISVNIYSVGIKFLIQRIYTC